jgi:Ran GTPase-activating protein (RanGAP) involved in mRNA processing and transport
MIFPLLDGWDWYRGLRNTTMSSEDDVCIQLENLLMQLEANELKTYFLDLGTIYSVQVDSYLGKIRKMLESNRSLGLLSFCRAGTKYPGVVGSQWDSEALSFFGFLKMNSTLHTLNLAGCRINDDAMETLCSCLKENSSLRCLNLSQGRFERLDHMADALTHNISLQELKLSRSLEIPLVHWQALSKALAENSNLLNLEIDQCIFSPVAVEAIAGALKINCSLRSLNLGNNIIGIQGFTALMNYLEMKDCLS